MFERKHLASLLSSNKLDHEVTTALLNSKLVYKIDNQQGPTVEHRELYSISCNNL